MFAQQYNIDGPTSAEKAQPMLHTPHDKQTAASGNASEESEMIGFVREAFMSFHS
jgi:hypothetical protein